MDPLSISAGVIAVSGAAIATTKLSRSLFKLAKTSGPDLCNEIRFFSQHVQQFSTTVSSTNKFIDDYSKQHEQSTSILRLVEHQTLQGLASQMKEVHQRIQMVKRPQVNPKTNYARLVVKNLIWYYDKREREEICIWMARLKLDFLSIMVFILYELLRSREDELNNLLEQHLRSQSGDMDIIKEELRSIRREMKDRREVIEANTESMIALRDQQELFSRKRTWLGDEENPSSLQDIEGVLLSLGKSVIKRQKLDHTSTSSTRSRRGSSQSSQNSRSPPISHIQQVQSPSIMPLPLNLNTAKETPPASVSQHHESSIETSRSLVTQRRQVLQYQENKRCTRVIKKVNHIRVTGVKNPELHYNLISLALVKQANIKYKPNRKMGILTELEDENGNRQAVLGKVVLNCSDGMPKESAFHDLFYICGHLPNGYPFIVGRRYIEMTEQLTDRRRQEA